LRVYEYNASNEVINEYTLIGSGSNWINETLISYDYNAAGLVIRTYFSSWVNSAWEKQTSVIYDYGPLNRIIHEYHLYWLDTAWFYDVQYVNEVDVNGYPTYENTYGAYYDNDGTLYWESWYGPSYTTYSSTGQLLSYHGHNIPGGPYSGYSVIVGGILRSFHSHYESMGGFVSDNDTYYYYAELLGDSSICAGQSTILYADSCPGYSYHWSTGATTSSITVSNPGTYYVQVTNANGFTAISQPVSMQIVTGLPYISATPDSSMNVCSNAYTQLSVPLQSGVNYHWHRNDSILNSNSPSISFSPLTIAEGIYYLTVSNACGIDTSAQTTISIIPAPANPIITMSGSASFCQGDSITLTSSPGNSYRWSPNNETTQSITVGNSGNYTVWIYGSNGCFAKSVNTYTYARPYPVSMNVNLSNGILQASYYSYSQWFLNGDSIVGATGPSYTPVLPGYYQIAQANYLPCISYSDSIYIDPSTVNVSIPGLQYVCENGGVYIGGFNPIVGGTPPYNYSWSPNTNLINYGNGRALVSNVTSNGTYYLTVTDSLGLSATDSVNVLINYPLVPELYTLYPDLCSNQYNSVRINNYGASFSVVKWIVNGDTLTTSNSSISLATSGIYQAIIANQYGCKVASEPDTIILNTRPSTPIIHADLDSNSCINGLGTLWINSNPGETYMWRRSPGNLVLSTDTMMQSVSPFEYTVYVTDSNGCDNYSTINFELSIEEIFFNINFNTYELCGNDTVTLTAPDFSGWTYSWYYDENLISDTTNVISATLPGGYECIATSPSGCTASGNININQYVQSIPTITLNGGILSSVPLQHVSYQWFHNGVEIAGATSNNYTPFLPGEYFLRTKKWNGYGSQCYVYSNVIYYGLCSVNINPVDSVLCVGHCTAELFANAIGAGSISYDWSNGDVSDHAGSLCAGNYSVTITDSIGCIASDSIFIDTDIISFTTNSVNATCIGCVDGNISFNILQGSPPYVVSWLPMNGSLNTTTINGLPAGIYQFCITDNYGCIHCAFDTVFDNTTSTHELEASTITYYPNPVINEITIDGLSESGSMITKIYSNTGQLIKTFDSIIRKFSVSEFASGIYTIEIFSDRRVYHLRFVKI
jgi:hypothetical protein